MKSSILFVVGLILGAVIVYLVSMYSAVAGPVRYTCEQSGGTISGSTCLCPVEPMVLGAPAFTYEEETGMCIDSFGIPGGEFGEQAKKLLELETLKN